jgi:hypothetical protein
LFLAHHQCQVDGLWYAPPPGILGFLEAPGLAGSRPQYDLAAIHLPCRWN